MKSRTDGLSDTMATMLSDYVIKTPGTCGGKPRLKGHRIRVQDIAYYSEWCGWNPDQIADSLNLTLAEVHAALVYYFENMDEIREDLQKGNDLVEEMKRCNSSKLARKISQIDMESESKSA